MLSPRPPQSAVVLSSLLSAISMQKEDTGFALSSLLDAALQASRCDSDRAAGGHYRGPDELM